MDNGLTDFANNISNLALGINPNFTPDGWDISGASISTNQAFSNAVAQLFASEAEKAQYIASYETRAVAALLEAESQIARTSGLSGNEIDSIRRTAQTTADGLSTVGWGEERTPTQFRPIHVGVHKFTPTYGPALQ